MHRRRAGCESRRTKSAREQLLENGWVARPSSLEVQPVGLPSQKGSPSLLMSRPLAVAARTALQASRARLACPLARLHKRVGTATAAAACLAAFASSQ